MKRCPSTWPAEGPAADGKCLRPVNEVKVRIRVHAYRDLTNEGLLECRAGIQLQAGTRDSARRVCASQYVPVRPRIDEIVLDGSWCQYMAIVPPSTALNSAALSRLWRHMRASLSRSPHRSTAALSPAPASPRSRVVQ